MAISEDQLGRWAQAPSETEDQRCTNSITQITNALRSAFGNDVAIIRQGSHANRTNVRIDSDVDVAVVHTGYYFPDTSFLNDADKQRHRNSFVAASYTFGQFKNDVERVLQGTFDARSVERKNKCIRVIGNSNRVNADVVPAFEHKRFQPYGVVTAKGIEFVTDAGMNINSFPEQHYASGVKKNDDTGKNYKATVRILKRARNQLIDDHVLADTAMPSFFLECLVWNAPTQLFFRSTWREIIEAVTAKVWNDARNPEVAKQYAEVSNLKWLFHSGRTYKQAEDFMLHAWRYITQ